MKHRTSPASEIGGRRARVVLNKYSTRSLRRHGLPLEHLSAQEFDWRLFVGGIVGLAVLCAPAALVLLGVL
jgi:hypothetical protein